MSRAENQKKMDPKLCTHFTPRASGPWCANCGVPPLRHLLPREGEFCDGECKTCATARNLLPGQLEKKWYRDDIPKHGAYTVFRENGHKVVIYMDALFVDTKFGTGDDPGEPLPFAPARLFCRFENCVHKCPCGAVKMTAFGGGHAHCGHADHYVEEEEE